MEIKRLSLAKGAQEASGCAIVIDVFRGFSSEPLLYHCGAEKIFLESDIEKCLAMRHNAILVGEKDGMPIDGFHVTNSPYLILQKGASFFSGHRVVHRTSAGVTGALTALHHANEVLLASFMTARATATYVLSQKCDIVSIIAMGNVAREKSPEDECCADYLEALLTEKPYDHLASIGNILAHESAQKFLRGDKWYLPKEDPAICLQKDLFPFTLRAEQRGDYVEAVRVY
ncbi:MAG: 2-phosphosulfolactate phosphatase [bacterium]